MNKNENEKFVKDIACPLKALVIDEFGNFHCTKPTTKHSSLDIKEVNLGHIFDDVKLNCDECKLMFNNIKNNGIKNIKINDFHEVICPNDNLEKNIHENCKNCVCLFKACLLEKQAKKENNDLVEIPCAWPQIVNIPKLFLKKLVLKKKRIMISKKKPN